MSQDSLSIKVWRHYFNTDSFRCDLCGDSFYQAWPVTASLCQGDESEKDGLRLCPLCLDAGPKETAQRARAYAERLHKWANEVAAVAAVVEILPAGVFEKALRDLEAGTDAAKAEDAELRAKHPVELAPQSAAADEEGIPF